LDRFEIIEIFAPAVQAIARSLSRLGDAEDLESVGMVKLVELAYEYDPSRAETFGAYLRASVRGAMLDYLRSESFDTPGVVDIADHRQPDTDVVDLDEMVSDLPRQQARVLELRRQDLTQSQVANVMGITKQAVSRIELRAKERLRKLAA
jgi:RNA polymerase sigma factor (sigma-70 family)